ncbi:MAG TPA: response regulator [Blastocatellia bacterium]
MGTLGRQASNHKRILVADDDRIIREYLKTVLSRAGYEVIFAGDGEEALKLAASEHPALVLSDGLLPKLHGFQACKSIKSLENPPKVIILTGVYTKPTYKYQVMNEYGADDFLNKPVDASQLLQSIAQQL